MKINVYQNPDKGLRKGKDMKALLLQIFKFYKMGHVSDLPL